MSHTCYEYRCKFLRIDPESARQPPSCRGVEAVEGKHLAVRCYYCKRELLHINKALSVPAYTGKYMQHCVEAAK
jgi:hypothetical protein